MLISDYIKYLQTEHLPNRSDALEFVSCIAEMPYEKVALSLFEDIDISKGEPLLERLKAGEPLAYIINNKNFYGADFYVDSRVLIPRPETEILVDEALKFAGERKNLRILDICTGSGCILNTLLMHLPDATGVAVDISSDALDVAGFNSERLDVDDRARFVMADALVLNTYELGTFDIIVCNPPYLSESEWDSSCKSLKYEPKNALSAGENDLLFYKKLMDMIPELCNKSCCGAFFELGLGQYDRLIADGYCKGWKITKDYQQIERVVSWTNLS